MKIQPKIRGFICTTAHPEGCQAHVEKQIDYVMQQPKLTPVKNALVIGCSTGYGLASRIALQFGADAKTLGVCFEKPPEPERCASAGYYNTAAFEQNCLNRSLYARTINGDAFSDEIKTATIQAIKKDFGKIDILIYSLASPKRLHPETGRIHQSCLKPIGQTYTSKTVDVFKAEVKEITIEPASSQEIEDTIAVMGGDDWLHWIDALRREEVLSEQFKTVAYSYIGPALTHSIYRDGTIGRAKQHLIDTATIIHQRLQKIGGTAAIAVAKAVVTQASAAIPVVPLYLAILFKIMKARGEHEGCIEQMHRLLRDETVHLNSSSSPTALIRLDDRELNPDVQHAVEAIWAQVNTENILELTDLVGYQHDFYNLFGFSMPNVDYDQESDPMQWIPSLRDNL